MNYTLKVVKLVSFLLVVNYVVDLMMCVILVLCMIYHVYSVCFGGSETTKIGSGKKIKLLYLLVKGPHVSRGLPLRPHILSVNR
jgi:hypothetical protein